MQTPALWGAPAGGPNQDRIQIKPASSSIFEWIVSDREQLHLIISCMDCEPFTMADLLHIPMPKGGGLLSISVRHRHTKTMFFEMRKQALGILSPLKDYSPVSIIHSHLSGDFLYGVHYSCAMPFRVQSEECQQRTRLGSTESLDYFF